MAQALVEPLRKKKGGVRIMKGAHLIFIFLLLVMPASAQAKSYERIVSLAPSITEILFAMGAGDRVVGVTTFCNYPEEAKGKPKVGGFTTHNLEAIVLQSPDLVIMTPNRESKFTYEELTQLGIETLVVPLYGLQDLVDAFEVIGTKLDVDEDAKKIQTQLLGVIDEMRIKGQNRKKRKVALLSWQAPLIVPASNTLEGDIIELVGGETIALDTSLHYPKLGLEAFFKHDPDIIIDASNHGNETTVEEREHLAQLFWGQYPDLQAVRNNNVFVFRNNVYSVPGPRTYRFIQALNAIMDPTTHPKHNEFYVRVKF